MELMAFRMAQRVIKLMDNCFQFQKLPYMVSDTWRGNRNCEISEEFSNFFNEQIERSFKS